MRSTELSFLALAGKTTLNSYQYLKSHSRLGAEVISCLAAVALLSPAAALDFALHSLCVVPTFAYAIGKSIYQRKIDFTIPWQHLQRVRNAIAPLFLGSIYGAVHPYVGLVLCEPTDKHAVLGMLSSNSTLEFVTPCSPVHSLEIVEQIAKKIGSRIPKITEKKYFLKRM